MLRDEDDKKQEDKQLVLILLCRRVCKCHSSFHIMHIPTCLLFKNTDRVQLSPERRRRKRGWEYLIDKAVEHSLLWWGPPPDIFLLASNAAVGCARHFTKHCMPTFVDGLIVRPFLWQTFLFTIAFQPPRRTNTIHNHFKCRIHTRLRFSCDWKSLPLIGSTTHFMNTVRTYLTFEDSQIANHRWPQQILRSLLSWTDWTTIPSSFTLQKLNSKSSTNVS